MTKPQYAGPWTRIRKQVLARDGYRCQIGLEGCTLIATQVDHIMPVALGGAWFDQQNLRAACAFCNSARRQGTQNRPEHSTAPSSRQWYESSRRWL